MKLPLKSLPAVALAVLMVPGAALADNDPISRFFGEVFRADTRGGGHVRGWDRDDDRRGPRAGARHDDDDDRGSRGSRSRNDDDDDRGSRGGRGGRGGNDNDDDGGRGGRDDNDDDD